MFSIDHYCVNDLIGPRTKKTNPAKYLISSISIRKEEWTGNSNFNKYNKNPSKSATQTSPGVQTRRVAKNSVRTRSATKMTLGLQRTTKKK